MRASVLSSISMNQQPLPKRATQRRVRSVVVQTTKKSASVVPPVISRVIVQPPRVRKPRVSRSVMTMPDATSGGTIGAAYSNVTTTSARSTTIVHEELFDTVKYTTATANSVSVINARAAGTFAWLSLIAKGYDMYNFRKLEFVYKPSCGSTTVGSLVMAFDYDVTDDNTDTPFAALAAYAGAVSGQLYSPNMVCRYHPENTVISAHKYFCKANGAVDRLSDVANFIFALNVPVTTTSGTVFGQIWARYTVDLFNPELTPTDLSVSSLLTKAVTATAMQPATNTAVMGPLQDLAALLQKPGSPTTDPFKIVSEFLVNHPTIVGQVLDWVEKTGFGLQAPKLLTGWWKRDMITGDPVSIDLNQVADYVCILSSYKLGGDFLIYFRLQGHYVPIDPILNPSPRLEFLYNNVRWTDTTEVFYPILPSQAAVMSGNDYVISGYCYLGIADPDLPCAFGVTVNPTYGTWDGIKPNLPNVRASWIAVQPSAHLVMSTL